MSLFYGRIRDIGYDAASVVRYVRATFRERAVPCEIIVGSIRHIADISEAFQAGADIVTVPPEVLPADGQPSQDRRSGAAVRDRLPEVDAVGMDRPPIRVPYVALPLRAARVKRELMAAIETVVDHGVYILGPEVGEFERRFAALCGTRYAVGVGNGTSALILALRALGHRAGRRGHHRAELLRRVRVRDRAARAPRRVFVDVAATT